VSFQRLLGLVALVVAATAAPALADATGDLKNATLQFAKLNSYHIDMTGPHGVSAQVDYQKPGRMHAFVPHAETIMLDDFIYVKINNAWHKYPAHGIAKMMQPDYAKMISDRTHDFSAVDIGPRVVDGTPLHAYHVTNLKSHKVDTIYLDGAGRIARIETENTIIKVSKFNEPVTVKAPI
jgi:hypothetical protein